MTDEIIWFDVQPGVQPGVQPAGEQPGPDEPALVLVSSTRGELARTALTEDSLRALFGTLVASLQRLDAPAMAKIGKATAFHDPPARVSPGDHATILLEVEAIPGLALSFAWPAKTAARIAGMIAKLAGPERP
jgi:hypothetical protein